MLIVPYSLCHENIGLNSLWTLWVFLSKGVLWETDEEICSGQFIIDNYLTPNGFFGTIRKIVNGAVYFELDCRTKINNFYTWSEFLEKETEIPQIDLFRPFFWVGEELGDRDDWGWQEECEEISLGRLNLSQVWVDVAGLRDC